MSSTRRAAPAAEPARERLGRAAQRPGLHADDRQNGHRPTNPTPAQRRMRRPCRLRKSSAGRRRKRILQGLLVGGAAIGIPALINAADRAPRRHARTRPSGAARHRYAWRSATSSSSAWATDRRSCCCTRSGPGHDSLEWRRGGRAPGRTLPVFAPDLLGWGRSEKPPIAYDGELYIQFARRLPGRCRARAGGGRGGGPAGRLRGPGRGRPARAGPRPGPGRAARHRPRTATSPI